MDKWQEDRIYSLTMIGYTPGAPSQDAADIDGSVCAESTCTECGHVGLLYRPFRKPGSYRAFAICPECDHAEEF
jgi:hypothetical protein